MKFHSSRDNGLVERVCAPLHYGSAPGSPEAEPRYWVWDYLDDPQSNPLELAPDEVVSVRVLNQSFDLAGFRGQSKAPVLQEA